MHAAPNDPLGNAEPDDFHSDLLSRALDLPLAALGFDDQTPAADLASGELCCECDDAALSYRDGRYHLRMSKQLTNRSDRVVTRFLGRVSIDRYPHDPVKSNAHHRHNPLTVEELDLHAWCGEERMDWEVKHDRDAAKEFWLLFANPSAKFPLYPGETRWIRYSYAVGELKWGQWFQRAVRLPTRRLSVSLSFPAALDPAVWGTETSLTMGHLPLVPNIEEHRDGEDIRYRWATDQPCLHSRYRLEWKFRSPRTVTAKDAE